MGALEDEIRMNTEENVEDRLDGVTGASERIVDEVL